MRILYLDIDTLRADHMSCYGYNRKTTPNIDEIANEAVRFTNYYCSDAPCLPSRSALITGMFGIHTGVTGHGGTAADRIPFGRDRGFTNPIDENNFFNIFRKSGFYTASISTFAERHSAWWFNSGLNELHNVGGRGTESGEEVIPVALDWLKNNADRDNWFLHLQLWDPHTPYRAPAGFGEPFKDEPYGEWITEDIFNSHLNHIGPHGLKEINMFDDDEDPRFPRHPGKIQKYGELRKLFDGYDCGIKYADFLIGKVIKQLKDQEIFEDTAIIISADHGENLGELGIYAEHATADHPTCNIPLIVKWPNCQKGIVNDGLHYNIDLVPTVADLLGKKSFSSWDGQSFAESLLKGKSTGRENIVISQLAHVCQRSVRFGEWLYVRTYHDGYHLFDKEMLFNIKSDPHETKDLKYEHTEICNSGAQILLNWHDMMMKTSKHTTDPLLTVMKEGGPFHARGMLDQYLKRLEKTGRHDGASKLREKWGNEL